MPRVDGVPLGVFAFHGEFLKNRVASWIRYDLIGLCLNLSESVHTLHRYGVVMGDLHPGDVMVSSDGSVCWVDADRFHIEDYPCSAGTERFWAPELHGNFADFLRTRCHDTYALSVLLFRTLTLGRGNSFANCFYNSFSFSASWRACLAAFSSMRFSSSASWRPA